jgi:hypothetical protein
MALSIKTTFLEEKARTFTKLSGGSDAHGVQSTDLTIPYHKQRKMRPMKVK